MTINGNCRSLLLGGVAVMAGLALAGCNRDSSTSTATAPAATASTTNPVGSTPPPSTADASAPAADETGNEVADMERHHKQAMDHADMRAGAAKPDAPPPADSPAAPMKHM